MTSSAMAKPKHVNRYPVSPTMDNTQVGDGLDRHTDPLYGLNSVHTNIDLPKIVWCAPALPNIRIQGTAAAVIKVSTCSVFILDCLGAGQVYIFMAI